MNASLAYTTPPLKPMSINPTARAWVEVDLDALRANFESIRRAVGPGTALIPMVKADAYGLGCDRVVRALEPLAPWGYGVATAEEGIRIRELGVSRPILVFSPLLPKSIEAAARARLTACISDLGELEHLAAVAARTPGGLDFHVEVDTGMGRAGFRWHAVDGWAPAIAARLSDELRWTGVFTHFYDADAPSLEPSLEQWDRFERTLERLPVPRESLLVHAARSAAALRVRTFNADAVRPGIYLYGGHPAPELREGIVPPPRPVVSLRSRLLLVRDVPEGATVGYGATHVASAPARWGTIGIGYGDGLRRSLGNRGHAIVRGVKVPLIGRISMDLSVVDLTAVPGARVGDVVTLIGTDGDVTISLEDVADLAGTISYEILTGLAPRLPRVELPHGDDR